MNKSYLISNTEIFGGFYNQWRLVRVWKLEQIFGVDWFKGKKILELGCGYGNVGLYLKSIGADVTFVDARQEFLDVVLKKCPDAKVIKIDQDEKWDLKQKFDLVIHWGITYNIKNWEQDLKCALKHGSNFAYETAVNKFSKDIVIPIINPNYGEVHSGCYNKEGMLPSIKSIEKILPKSAIRYDDAKMNFDNIIYTNPCNFLYNGLPKTINTWNTESAYGGRKFWVVKV